MTYEKSLCEKNAITFLKLREKCPLNIGVIRYMAYFLPANMMQKQDVCIPKFARMYEGKLLKSQKGI